MLRILWNSESGMQAQQEKLDAISNNIANSSTNGYKKINVNFKDLVYETLDRKGYPVSSGTSKEQLTGSGTRTSNWSRDDSQGSKLDTGLKSDLYINGEGYFAVVKSDGTKAYTRCGNFSIDQNGSLTDKEGNRLVITDEYGNNVNDPENAESIKFTNDNYVVKEDGTVTITDGNTQYDAGKIGIYNAVGQDSMISVGSSMFAPKEGVNMYEVKKASVSQGCIEASNVDMSKEMTDMILTERAYQFSSKGLTTADEMWEMANNLKGR